MDDTKDVLGVAWRWQEPDATRMMKVSTLMHCTLCGEAGNSFVMFPHFDGSAFGCRECTLLSHGAAMSRSEWMVVPWDVNQADVLRATRLLRSVTILLKSVDGTLVSLRLLPARFLERFEKHKKRTVNLLEKVRGRLSVLDGMACESARIHERQCWLEMGVHPMDPGAPREGVVWWPTQASLRCGGLSNDEAVSERLVPLMETILMRVEEDSQLGIEPDQDGDGITLTDLFARTMPEIAVVILKQQSANTHDENPELIPDMSDTPEVHEVHEVHEDAPPTNASVEKTMPLRKTPILARLWSAASIIVGLSLPPDGKSEDAH